MHDECDEREHWQQQNAQQRHDEFERHYEQQHPEEGDETGHVHLFGWGAGAGLGGAKAKCGATAECGASARRPQPFGNGAEYVPGQSESDRHTSPRGVHARRTVGVAAAVIQALHDAILDQCGKRCGDRRPVTMCSAASSTNHVAKNAAHSRVKLWNL